MSCIIGQFQHKVVLRSAREEHARRRCSCLQRSLELRAQTNFKWMCDWPGSSTPPGICRTWTPFPEDWLLQFLNFSLANFHYPDLASLGSDPLALHTWVSRPGVVAEPASRHQAQGFSTFSKNTTSKRFAHFALRKNIQTCCL